MSAIQDTDKRTNQSKNQTLVPVVPSYLSNSELCRFAGPWLHTHGSLPFEWQREILRRLEPDDVSFGGLVNATQYK